MKRNARPTSYRVQAVPYEGHVGAGRVVPFPVPEGSTLEVSVPDYVSESEPLGTMTVCGDSLERVGIYDGDIVLCRKIFSKKQITRDTVCIVYARSLGEVNAKKIVFREGHLVLKYCGYRNEPDVRVPEEEVEIRGIVISASRHRREWPFIDIDDSDIPL